MSGGSGVDWSSVGTVVGGVGGFIVGGPAGAAVGASLGGSLGGVLEGDKKADIDTSWSKAGTGEQTLEQRLAAQAAGTGGPSVAELQMQAGLDKSNQNAMALAASQRGINPGLAASLASRQQGINQVETNAQSGLLRAQESQNSNQLLASMYASQRGSAQSAAAMQQQANQNAQQRQDNIYSAIGSAGLQYALSGNGAQAAPGGSTGSAGGAYQQDNVMVANKGALVKGKASVKGDSIKNDKVPAFLSPGEMVIPRTVVKKGPEAISAFAQALMMKEKKGA